MTEAANTPSHGPFPCNGSEPPNLVIHRHEEVDLAHRDYPKSRAGRIRPIAIQRIPILSLCRFALNNEDPWHFRPAAIGFGGAASRGINGNLRRFYKGCSDMRRISSRFTDDLAARLKASRRVARRWMRILVSATIGNPITNEQML